MLLTPHLLIGAALGLKIHNYWVVFLLAIIFHFLIDAIPHSHYNVDHLKEKIKREAFVDFLKVLTDVAIGVGLCMIFIWDSKYIDYALWGMIISILPDALNFFYWQTKTPLLAKFTDFHQQILHPKDTEKTPFLKGLISQIIVSIIAIAFIIIF